mgnify:CR=1 FL=1
MAREDREVRLSPMRRTIAERMCSSLNQTAQYTLTREIEIDGMLTYINEQKAAGTDAPAEAEAKDEAPVE